MIGTRPRGAVAPEGFIGGMVFPVDGAAGVVVGVKRCQDPGCQGMRLLTKWPDGHLTAPCSASIQSCPGGWALKGGR